MKTESMVVSYGVKRSRDFQSVDISVTMTITPGEGETVPQVFKSAMAAMVPTVDKEASAAIADIAEMARQGI